MRIALVTMALACMLAPARAQSTDAKSTDVKPTDEKALKTYNSAVQLMSQRMQAAALGEFKKADKQDDGHCLKCQKKMIKYGMELAD